MAEIWQNDQADFGCGQKPTVMEAVGFCLFWALETLQKF